MTLSGVGVVGPQKISKIQLSDHGVHLKGLQTLHSGLMGAEFAVLHANCYRMQKNALPFA